MGDETLETLWGELVLEMYVEDEALFLERLNEVRRSLDLPPRAMTGEAGVRGGEVRVERVVRVGKEMSLGERIAAARRARGMSQKELAKVAGCSVSLVSHVEQGKSRASVKFLLAVGGVLGLVGK